MEGSTGNSKNVPEKSTTGRFIFIETVKNDFFGGNG